MGQPNALSVFASIPMDILGVHTLDCHVYISTVRQSVGVVCLCRAGRQKSLRFGPWRVSLAAARLKWTVQVPAPISAVDVLHVSKCYQGQQFERRRVC